MVVRNVVPKVAEVLGASVIAHNCSVLQGIGELGRAFANVLHTTSPYAGMYYVEAVIQIATGQIDEILMPDPKRVYEKEVINLAGKSEMVPVPLSRKFPNGRLAVFLVDAHAPHQVMDVIARDEISPQARACLRQSVIESRTPPITLRVA